METIPVFDTPGQLIGWVERNVSPTLADRIEDVLVVAAEKSYWEGQESTQDFGWTRGLSIKRPIARG